MNVLVIPADAPAYTAAFMRSLDGAISQETVVDTDDARISVARHWHGHPRTDGATKFYLWHWLRLFEAQAEARAAGKPLPVQAWTQTRKVAA